MHQRLAVPLAAALLALGTVAAAPAQSGDAGPCAAARPLTGLASGTRIFVRTGFSVKQEHAPSAAGEAASERLVIRGADARGVPSRETAVTGAADAAETGPVLQREDASGNRMTVRPTAMICAFPPGTELPAWAKNATPDIVIP